jgi:hypothetical protein
MSFDVRKNQILFEEDDAEDEDPNDDSIDQGSKHEDQ